MLPSNVTTTKRSERNQNATVYIRELDEKVDDELLFELFLQVGPVVSVNIPRDRLTQQHNGYGFVEFQNEADADYACLVLNMIQLYSTPIRVKKAHNDKAGASEVGAKLFVRNLAHNVTDLILYSTFSTFGRVIDCTVATDPMSGDPKGYGFVSFDNFDGSDEAIRRMNGQPLRGKAINVQYAINPATKTPHGSEAERAIAAKAVKHSSSNLPAISANKYYAVSPPQLSIANPLVKS